MSMDAWFQCWTRSEKCQEEPAEWLTEQLKFTRDQLDKKLRQCEQLDAENKRLQARSNEQEVLLGERSRLREELDAVKQELERLREDLSRERELHQEASRLLRQQRDEKVRDLQEELRNLSDGLAQKEEDVLNIQFSMAELQNRCMDQGALVVENADAFQKASEELAEKEEALENATARQQELMAQMNLVSSELQAQVLQLSRDLELSKASNERLQQHASRLEEEKAALSAEMQQLRLKALSSEEAMNEKLRQQEKRLSEAHLDFKQELLNLGGKALELRKEGSRPCRDLSLEPRGFPAPGEPVVPSVLIAVEIDLLEDRGPATLTIAPWQTSSDYKAVVQDFIKSHRLKPIFEDAVVRYLQELERTATTLPLFVKVSLAEIYREHG